MDLERLRFLFGIDDLDKLAEFDLEEESERAEAVERYAGLPADVGDRVISMAMRTVVINQVLDDDPPEAWQTVQRLRDEGLDRHQVLSQLAMVNTDRLMAALEERSPFDVGSYIGALAQLPLPTEADVAQRLVDTARAQPGIAISDHIGAVVASFGAGAGEVVRKMADRVLDELVGGPLHWLPNDRTMVVPDHVNGATFTHRFNDAEAQLEVLSAAFDLGGFSRVSTVRLPDGTEIDQFSVERTHLGWRGPQGWLDRFKPGDLLACTIKIDNVDDAHADPIEGTVTIEVVADEPAVTDDLVGFVRAGYDDLVAEPWLPVSGGELTWWLLFHHAGLFDTTQPPLSELCAAAGLEQRAGQVAHEEDVWRHDLFFSRLSVASDHVSEPHWRSILSNALEVLDDPDAPIDEIRGALDACAEPETLNVLADVLFRHYLDVADEFELGQADAPGYLFELVNRAIAVAHRPRETATAEYLACVLYERCGESEVAEAHLKKAADAQSELGPVVERMGWYRFDRGDARGAMRWWQKLAELPDAAKSIKPFLSPAADGRKLGRNEPCWCGSGRKFKQCHLNSTELPSLPDRVGWLCSKASIWLDHAVGEQRDTIFELATARATGDSDIDPWDLSEFDDDEMLDLLDAAFADPIVFDAALHEGRLFNLFLYERNQLLPDDEQLLAASWRTIDRSVHEVVSLDPGVGMELRNLGTGDVVDVRERTASTGARVGDRYCARVVPDGASHQIIGAMFPVRAGHETEVLDLCAGGDPVELCAWVGRLDQPPTVVHIQGLLD